MSAPVTYMVELWYDVWREMAPLWQDHWREIAINQSEIPLDPDVAQYEMLQANGMLCVLVARAEGKIVGYYISIIKPHLHYRTTLHAFTDVYYVLPAYRNGWCGIRLFQKAEEIWKERGVVKAFTATKLHLDMSAILERLEWVLTERTFSKLIKG